MGYATAAHGLNGELKVEPTTDFPDRFAAGEQLWVKGQPLKIESCRQQGSRLLLKLDSIDSREAAKELQGQVLEIPISKAQPLPPGQYYVFQIIGLEVHTTAGEYLGQVAEVMPVAGSDVYLVRGPRGELLIPAIGDVVKHIDLEHGRMTVEPIEGLL